MPSESSGGSISTTLYFVRLGADLAFRPLASYTSWHRINSMRRLRAVAVARVSLLAVFMGYTFVKGLLPVSDGFIIAVSVCLFGSSGFLSILSYSLGSESLGAHHKAARAHCGAVINQAFQLSVFLAVIASEAVAFSVK